MTSRLAPPILSTMALILSFWGLFEWDVPLTRYVRSLNDFQIDHLANPWLAQLSDIGNRLGRGESLVILSLVILAVGYGLTEPIWKSAGWHSLLAHGIAGILSNLVKHLVGRPRPKFMHAGNFDFSPAGGNGWDSFPSGHTTASFAVAAVLAARFPRIRWIILCVAAAIAISRILRGAHFLTDIVGGAVLGYLVGAIVARPWRDWRSSLEDSLFSLTSFLVALFALVWTIGHRPSDLWPAPQLIGTGMLMTIIGLVGHVLRVIRLMNLPTWLSQSLTRSLIGFGLGMATGSAWVMAAVFCVCLAHWLRHRGSPAQDSASTLWPDNLTKEAAFSLLVLIGLWASVELRGALPML